MCFDQIPRFCRLCGSEIPMGTTWHGQHIDYYEWLEQYGNVCVYCEHGIENEVRKAAQAAAPGRRRRR